MTSLIKLVFVVAAVAMASASLAQNNGAGSSSTNPAEHGKQHRNGTSKGLETKDSGRIIIPESSVPKSSDRAHTHLEILNTHGPVVPPHPGSGSQPENVK